MLADTSLPKIGRIVMLSVIVMLQSCALTLLSEARNFHSLVNGIWLVGVPILLGLLAGKTHLGRLICAVFFVILSLGAAMVFAYAYWGGI